MYVLLGGGGVQGQGKVCIKAVKDYILLAPYQTKIYEK